MQVESLEQILLTGLQYRIGLHSSCALDNSFCNSTCGIGIKCVKLATPSIFELPVNDILRPV
jgi:hypothetical protein